MHFSAIRTLILITATFSAYKATSGDEITTESIDGVFQVELIANEPVTAADDSPKASSQSCGLSKYSDAGNMVLPAPLIVGGQQARLYEFPWQVSMQYNGKHRCGGSIVAQSWILTAAHCVSDLTLSQIKAYMTITAGEYRLSDATSTARQVFRVVNVKLGDYNSTTKVNDIALLQLGGTISFNVNVAPVCLPASTSSFVFRKSVASGWGVTRFGSSTESNVLLYTTLNITTNSICNSILYRLYGKNTIYNSMMCTRDNINDYTRDTCQGDSGGPLVVKGTDGTFTLAGLTSWGFKCASGYPGVYTRVSSYIDSINQIINNYGTSTTRTTSRPTSTTTRCYWGYCGGTSTRRTTSRPTSTTTRCYWGYCGSVSMATSGFNATLIPAMVSLLTIMVSF